jgi:hypothetical protein
MPTGSDKPASHNPTIQRSLDQYREEGQELACSGRRRLAQLRYRPGARLLLYSVTDGSLAAINLTTLRGTTFGVLSNAFVGEAASRSW